VRRIFHYLPLLFVLPCCISLASAQAQFDLGIGFGGIHASAASGQVDQALLPCTGASDLYPPCVSTPSLSGFMLGFMGDLMLKKQFGVGAEVALQPAQQQYVNLNASAASEGLTSLSINSRMTLFDFNGIYQPISTKKAQLKIQVGVGDANLKFYESGSSTSVLGNANSSGYIQSANHFNLHAGVSVDIFVTDHIFIRPQFDLHYIPNLNQYGTSAVVDGMVWVGYSWGDR